MRTDRRQHGRQRRRLLVRYGEKTLSESGFTWDVSPGGVFIVASKLVPLDTRLHLQLLFSPERYLLFEAEVRRHKVVPAQLRTLERSGFGVRLIPPRELLEEALGLRAYRFELRFPTRESFKAAYTRELRLGAAFVSTTKVLERDTPVTLCLRLEFAQKELELASVVVRAYTAEQTGGHPGLGIVFQERRQAEELLKPYLA